MAARFTGHLLMRQGLTGNRNFAGMEVAGNYDAVMNILGRSIRSCFWLSILGGWIFLCSANFAGAQTQSREAEVESFFTAIQMGDTNAAATLLESNTNLVHARENMSKLPLLEAAAAGNVALVKRLLQLGADINETGDTRLSGGSQMTALHEAIQHNQPQVCRLLLESGANPNVMAFGFTTPLHLAFSENREEMASWLLDYGAEPFQGKLFSNDETTPFELAITHSQGRLVPRMLGQDAQHPVKTKPLPTPRRSKPSGRGLKTSAEILSQHGNELLAAAAQRGELEAVQALLTAGVSAKNSNPNCPTLLQSFSLAASTSARNRPSVADQSHRLQDQLKGNDYANAGASFVASLRTQETGLADQLAMMTPERWQTILETLIEHGVDYDVFAATALGDINQAKRLVSANGNAVQATDCNGQTPLHWAVQTDRLPLAAFWIQAGVPLAATNLAGQTALHTAAAAGKIEFVKLLLAAKAPADLRDTNGWTPLEAAIQAKQAESIHLLLGEKSAPAHPERGLAMTLHEAAASGNIAALAAVLETETNLEVRNELGLTPLQLAVTQGHLAAAALLVDKGADLNVRDPDGNSLLHRIFLLGQFTVYDRPPASWLAALPGNTNKQTYIQYLTVGQYEQGPNPILQETSFLLACGLNAQATNHAGQTVLQIIMDEKTGRGVFFFDDDEETIIKLLTGAGGKIDLRDAEGNTALHRLANIVDANKIDLLKSLVACGADVNATNNLGQTPLHKAAERIWGWDLNGDGSNVPFQLLVKSGANVNAQDNQGRTPLEVLLATTTSYKEEATVLLIKAGAKLNQTDQDGLTPLHQVVAADTGFSSRTVQSLLDAGANPNARDKFGRTPVHLLLAGQRPWSSNVEILQKLAAAGADISAKDNDGKTPLHYLAAWRRQSPMVFMPGIDQIFVNAKVDFNARDNEGNTPLHIAAKTGTRDVFDWLAKHGAGLDETNHAGETPRLLSAHAANGFSRSGSPSADTDIFTAAREGKLETLSALIQADPTLVNLTNQFNQTPLRVAILARRTNVVEFLDHHGATWDIVSSVLGGRTQVLREILARQPGEIATKDFYSSLLHLAAANGDAETTAILLEAKADWREQDLRGLTPLGVARLKNQPEVAKALRQRGASENIFDVAYTGGDAQAEQLLQRDKSLAAATNAMGWPAADIAAGAGQTEVLRRLLDSGASAERPGSYDGRTPLHLAAMYNQTNTARLLIRRGANVNAFDRSGFTPLHLAALRGAAEVAEILIKHKADPNQLMSEPAEETTPEMPMMGGANAAKLAQESPLHLAAAMGQTNMIRLLLASGASVNAVDGMGRTPLDLAKSADFPPNVFWFQRRLGRMDPLGVAEPAPFANRNSLVATIADQQKTAATLLENAGGKSRRSSQQFGPPPGGAQ